MLSYPLAKLNVIISHLFGILLAPTCECTHICKLKEGGSIAHTTKLVSYAEGLCYTCQALSTFLLVYTRLLWEKDEALCSLTSVETIMVVCVN